MNHSTSSRAPRRPRHNGLNRLYRIALTLVLTVTLTERAQASDALVAVAANFADPASALKSRFEAQSRHRLTLSYGSTGKLYAQIRYGAPYDLLIAADQERPRLLEQARLVVEGSRQTYAIGRLALWSPDPAMIANDAARVLREADFARLAIANPRLAPYGAAAVQALQALGIYERLQDRLVFGDNVGQTFAMVGTGNADLGLVALSNVLGKLSSGKGSYSVIPAQLHSPIRQDAVILNHGRANEAARDFLQFITGSTAKELISGYGYDTE